MCIRDRVCLAGVVISVVDIASKGVVFDTPPVALAQNIFTDVKNVRFKDGAVQKMPGELLLNNTTGATGPAKYFAVWENPNRQPTGVYYVYVVDKVSAGVVVGQQIFVQDHLGNKVDVTPSSLNSGNGFQATDDREQKFVDQLQHLQKPYQQHIHSIHHQVVY